MKLNLSKPIYVNLLGCYMVLTVVSMHFGSAVETVQLIVYVAAAVTLLGGLLCWLKLISTEAGSLASHVENFFWSAALPALILSWLGAGLYWLSLCYAIVYGVLRFGPNKISLPRLRGEVIFWSGSN